MDYLDSLSSDNSLLLQAGWRQQEYQSRLFVWIIPILASLAFLRYLFNAEGNDLVKAPIVGPKNRFWARCKFFFDASSVQDGYNQFRNSMFKLAGGTILIISNKYADELRNIGEPILSQTEAIVDSFQGMYSTVNIFKESDLHSRVIHAKVNHKLSSIVPMSDEELILAFKHIPINQGQWTPHISFDEFMRLVTCVTARLFVGTPLCRDEEWLSTTTKFSDNAWKLAVFLRLFPDPLKPIVQFFCPPAWAVSKYHKRAIEIIAPVVIERRRMEASGSKTYQKPDDFLQWMMDDANDFDGQPHKLAHRLLIMTLASSFTTTMALTQAFFDLCAHPEYIEPLREEVSNALEDNSGLWDKKSFTKMRKLDSFMRESQRLNPPSLLGFKRRVRESIILSDGVRLPKNSVFYMAIAPIMQDAAITLNPDQFDGFRHYQARLERGQNNLHQFTTTDSNNMHFGHGRYACPGRFLAGYNMKLILSRLLMEYDFKFPNGTGRPPNIKILEYIFPNPNAQVLLRARAATQV